MTLNGMGFSPFTAVTGTHMMCPEASISETTCSPTSGETLRSFSKEMQPIKFHDFSTGDCHSMPVSFIPKDLHTCPKVWLRVDRIRKSLEAPYISPYNVLHREPKYFVLELPKGNISVSIDMLKPAYKPYLIFS